MDYSDDAPLCRFGTPLDPLEEDEVPSKKPVAIEDQIVTDENGRRRFHGAFTGGFSAGFWNTVGSLEGWKPQSFKSSRSEKAEKRQQQLPTDFMDDEDLGEFGIAPQRVQAREDFAKNDESSSKKRKLNIRDQSSGIPGIPVLHQLLEPARDKVAVRLLKRMGWKPNQGIGARQTRREKTRSQQQNAREMYVMKMYGCTPNSNEGTVEKPQNLESDGSDKDDDDDDENIEITFAPDDYEPFVCSVKDNVFGLGYSGLARQVAGNTKTHINLFGPLEVLGKDNKKLSIRGQAFGVGALEEEDEDIYAKDDMTQYDFSLGDKKKRNRRMLPQTQEVGVLEGFSESSTNSNVNKIVHIVELKANFKPRNWLQRKSRFDPLPEEKQLLLTKNDETKRKGLGRHDLNPDDRRNILEGVNRQTENVEMSKTEASDSKKSFLQQINEKYKERESKTKKLLDLLSKKEDNFVKGGLVTSAGIEIMQPSKIDESVENENQKIQDEASKITKSLDKAPEVFKPFASNELKQERYETFIEANLHKEEEIRTFLKTIQPVHLSDWDREMEVKEFVQARNIYKPLNGAMSERFVSKTTDDIAKPLTKLADIKIKVDVKRTKVLWKPCSLICKRFNIPEPHGGILEEPKVSKKKKFSVFDYIENSVNTKKDFVTPVIIPKHIEKPKQIQTQIVNEVKKEVNTLTPSITTGIQTEHHPFEARPLDTNKNSWIEKKKTKTELELRVEESKDKHPSEKKDLFKCIFDSSIEEEEGEDQEDEVSRQEAANTSASAEIANDIINSLVKPTVPVNILRNNSPPRGIFAALLSKPEKPEENSKIIQIETETKEDSNKITFKPKNKRINEQTDTENENTYGPKIPDILLNKKTETKNETDIDKRLVELLSSHALKKTKQIEEWVEKKSSSSKKSKKEKHEKKKKDHKKHEHKHKKSKKQKKDKK